MNTTVGTRYERLALELVEQLRLNSALSTLEPSSGATNRIRGASGFPHQIDLSLSDSGRLFLFELKCYTKAIGVEQLLVLASRRADIAAAFPRKTVLASLVSKLQPSRNVRPLAKHFGIEVRVVESLHSYSLSFAGDHFIGHHEQAHASDSVSVVRSE